MNCRDFQRLASGSKANPQAEDPKLSRRFSRHLGECAECADFAHRMEAVRDLLEAPANRDARPDPGFSSRVVASLPEPASPLAWATVRLLPATTALALVLLGWCWLETPSPFELLERAGEDDLLTWVLTP